MDIYYSQCGCLASGYAPQDVLSQDWKEWDERWRAELWKHHQNCCAERTRLGRRLHANECWRQNPEHCPHTEGKSSASPRW